MHLQPSYLDDKHKQIIANVIVRLYGIACAIAHAMVSMLNAPPPWLRVRRGSEKCKAHYIHFTPPLRSNSPKSGTG